jgi:hypothetical protein
MKYTIILLASLITLISSCDSNGSKEADENGVIPPALQLDETSSRFLSSDRKDIVERLYADIVERSADMKHLEARLDNLPEKKTDSMAAYDQYVHNNKTYYSQAGIHARKIADSLLRNQVTSIIAQSNQRFNAITSKHEGLKKQIEDREREITDLHETLKLLTTLPVIQDYQKNNLPSSQQIQRLLGELNGIKAQLDSLTKLKKI